MREREREEGRGQDVLLTKTKHFTCKLVQGVGSRKQWVRNPPDETQKASFLFVCFLIIFTVILCLKKDHSALKLTSINAKMKGGICQKICLP